MNATILDLRYRMNKVLAALDNREMVQVLYHGKVKGVIMPLGQDSVVKTAGHAFFGSQRNDADEPVAGVMKRLRVGRHRVV
jgi:hypothetical protein